MLFLSVATWLTFASANLKVYNIPSTIQNGTSTAVFTSAASGFDAPKVQPINGSVFDWWYFDVVSTDPSVQSSVVVIFFTSSQHAFPLLSESDTVLPVEIWASFPNGTLWEAKTNGTSAAVVVNGDDSSGKWTGTGFSWEAASSTRYTITIDAPAVAPAHYPCGAAVAGQNLEVGPHIGWANSIPDAAAFVDLIIEDTPLKFTGAGYHDKNWSDQPFTTHVASWYWGHGRVGSYSIVWFDFLDTTGAELVSAYAAVDNKIVAASCTLGSIQVRPTGPNATYPPVLSTPDPTGYHIDLDLGAAGTLQVDVSVRTHIIAANPEYARLIGNVTATVVPPGSRADHDKKSNFMTGTALFEQFKLTS
ncbi:hypothetical protein K438DRAFT_1650522 [Mycena galopus ATCC 62051]|nr:hypothetical protein K438DRAFT_1650522 [Mycena galopus ATCC 62051]